MQAEFADRLQTMVNLLGAFDLRWQPGVPSVWLLLPQGWRVSSFTRKAETAGVLVRPADEYALIGGRAPNALRRRRGPRNSRVLYIVDTGASGGR